MVSELIKIDRGTYIVKVLVQVNNVILATALAGADTVEAAEDAARQRAIAVLFLDEQPANNGVIEATSSKTISAATISQTEVKPSPATFIESNIEATPLDNQNIVNFSEADFKQSELSSIAETNITTSNPIPESTPTQPKHQSVVKDTTQSINTANNLFGETFTAEIPQNSATLSANSVPESIFEANSVNTTAEIEAMDFNEIKQQTDIEIKRLGWTKDRGKEFLKSRYGKRSRLHLTDEQLLEFLRYLEKLPNPVE